MEREKNRISTVEFVQESIEGNVLRHLPSAIQYIINLPNDSSTFQVIYSLNNQRIEEIIKDIEKKPPSLFTITERMKGVNQSNYSDGYIEKISYFPNNLTLSPPEVYGYRFTLEGLVYEVGFSYYDFSDSITPLVLLLILHTILSTSLIMFLTSALFNTSIMKPLNALIVGVKQANDGDYDVKVPVQASDEIGFLMQSFNNLIYTIKIATLSLKRANVDLEIRVEQRTEELEMIRLVTETLNQEVTLERAIKSGLEITMSLMNASSGWVILLDSNKQPYLAAAFSLDREQFIQESLRNIHAETCNCIEHLIEGKSFKPELINNCMFQQMEHIAVYLHSGDSPIGILNFTHPSDNPINKNELKILNTIGEALSAAIERARLYESEKEQRNIAEILQDTAVSFSSSLNIDQVLDQILDQIARLIPYDSASVMMVDSGKATINRIKGYEDFGESTIKITQWMSFNINSTPNLKKIYETKNPVIVSDTKNYSGWIPFEGTEHIRSWLGAPILSRDKVIALFSLDKTDCNFYTQKHANLLKTISVEVKYSS